MTLLDQLQRASRNADPGREVRFRHFALLACETNEPTHHGQRFARHARVRAGMLVHMNLNAGYGGHEMASRPR